MAFNVGGWNYGAFGGSGYGFKDVDAAIRQGASAFQLRQLHQRARREGLNTGGGVLAGIHAGSLRGLRLPRQLEVGHNFGQHGGWGFGMADITSLTGGDLYNKDHYGRVKEVADWGRKHGLHIGSGAESWMTDMKDRIETRRNMQNNSDALLAKAMEVMTPKEPPKPLHHRSLGHIVHGTTRIQGREQPKKRGRGTYKERFGRGAMREIFKSPLSIAAGGGGSGSASSSSVINTAA